MAERLSLSAGENEAPSPHWKVPQEAEVGLGDEERREQRGGERKEMEWKKLSSFFFFLLPSFYHLPLGKSPKNHCQGAGKCGLQGKGE